MHAQPHSQPEATDGLYDTTPTALAAVFGRRTREMIRTDRDPYEAARLAASFAFKAKPVLRSWGLAS